MGYFANSPGVSLSGEVRIAKHFSLISENWLIRRDLPTGSDGLNFSTDKAHNWGATISGGVRYMMSKGVAIDAGCFYSSEIGGGFAPHFNLTIPFGSGGGERFFRTASQKFALLCAIDTK